MSTIVITADELRVWTVYAALVVVIVVLTYAWIRELMAAIAHHWAVYQGIRKAARDAEDDDEDDDSDSDDGSDDDDDSRRTKKRGNVKDRNRRRRRE